MIRELKRQTDFACLKNQTFKYFHAKNATQFHTKPQQERINRSIGKIWRMREPSVVDFRREWWWSTRSSSVNLWLQHFYLAWWGGNGKEKRQTKKGERIEEWSWGGGALSIVAGDGRNSLVACRLKPGGKRWLNQGLVPKMDLGDGGIKMGKGIKAGSLRGEKNWDQEMRSGKDKSSEMRKELRFLEQSRGKKRRNSSSELENTNRTEAQSWEELKLENGRKSEDRKRK